MSKAKYDPLLGPDPNDDKEPSLNDLLGDLPTPTKQAVPKVKNPSVPQVQPMVSFIQTSTGKRITGPGTQYFVIKDPDKAHGLIYREASQVVVLPPDWKEGDPINGL